MIDSSEDTLWSMDTGGRIISYNRAFAQRMLDAFGVVVRPGCDTREMLPPELAEQWHGFYRKVQAEGTLHMEYQAYPGGLHDLLLSPIVHEGQFAGISAFMRDITERKRMERELEDSRDYIESLLESSTDEVVSVDRELRIVAFNSNFAKVMVESNGVMPRKGMLIREVIPPERAERWPLMFRKAEEEGHCTLEYDISGTRLLELNLNLIRQGGRGRRILELRPRHHPASPQRAGTRTAARPSGAAGGGADAPAGTGAARSGDGPRRGRIGQSRQVPLPGEHVP